MSILRAMDGKFYDVPDDKMAAYAVPQDKLDTVLEQSGVMKPQGSPQGGPPAGPQAGPQGGPQGGPAGGGAPGPVIVQIYAQPPAQGGAPALAPSSEGGDVDPYWWYRYYYVRPWYNYWGNW